MPMPNAIVATRCALTMILMRLLAAGISRDPHAPQTCNNPTTVQHQKDHLGAAIDSFKQAMEYRPNYFDSCSNTNV